MSPSQFRPVAAAAFLAALAGPAVADGYAQPVAAAPVAAPVAMAPAPMASADWTGFYAGGQLGFGSLSVDGADDDESGALYGVHAGYQRDFGRFVLGAEASFDATSIEVGDAVDVDNVARLGLRAGYDAGRVMPYMTLGAARATLSSAGGDDSYDGAYGGVGVSYALTDSIDLGAEVLRHRFDVEDADVDVTTIGIRASYRF